MKGRNMYFDRFDVCAAWYLWLTHNHGGQWSPEYERLCRLDGLYSPGLSEQRGELNENAQAIYDAIGGE
jgi:hypothetical protein